MLHILFLILKIIGIILLAILCLLVTLVMLFLFVPFVVRGRVDKGDEDFKARLLVKWMGPAFRFFLSYNGEMKMRLKVFGIQLLPRRKKRKKRRSRSREEENAGRPGSTGTETMPSSQPIPSLKEERKEKGITETFEKTGENAGGSAAGTAKEKPETGKSKGRAPFRKGLKKKKEKPSEPGKGEEVKNVLKSIIDFLKQEENRAILKKVLKVSGHMLKTIRFESLKGKVSFSLGSPDYTGLLLGALSMMPFLYGDEMQVTPDFLAEEAYGKGHVTATCRIRMNHVAAAAIRLLADKRIRQLISSLREERAG